MDTQGQGMPDPYDRLLGALHGLPDVVKTKPSTIRTVTPLVGNTQTWIVQTYRQVGQGDTVFVESVGGAGSLRIAFPPEVAEAIARQRDSLTAKTRSRAAKAVAQERKARGEAPAFLKNPGRRKARTKKRGARRGGG